MTSKDVDRLKEAAEIIRLPENCSFARGLNRGLRAIIEVADAIRINDETEEVTNDKE